MRIPLVTLVDENRTKYPIVTNIVAGIRLNTKHMGIALCGRWRRCYAGAGELLNGAPTLRMKLTIISMAMPARMHPAAMSHARIAGPMMLSTPMLMNASRGRRHEPRERAALGAVLSHNRTFPTLEIRDSDLPAPDLDLYQCATREVS